MYRAFELDNFTNTQFGQAVYNEAMNRLILDPRDINNADRSTDLARIAAGDVVIIRNASGTEVGRTAVMSRPADIDGKRSCHCYNGCVGQCVPSLL